MASNNDINDRSAQNWKPLNTSGISAVKLQAKNIAKVTNAELFDSIKILIAEAVKTLYGTADDEKYKKIVNLILLRIRSRIDEVSELVAANQTQLADIDLKLKTCVQEIIAVQNTAQKKANESLLNSIISAVNGQLDAFKVERSSIEPTVDETKTENNNDTENSKATNNTEPILPEVPINTATVGLENELTNTTAALVTLNTTLSQVLDKIEQLQTLPTVKTAAAPRAVKKEKRKDQKTFTQLLTTQFKRTEKEIGACKDLQTEQFTKLTKRVDEIIKKHEKSGFSLETMLLLAVLILPLFIKPVREWIFSSVKTLISKLWGFITSTEIYKKIKEGVDKFINIVTHPGDYIWEIIVEIKDFIVDYAYPFLKDLIVKKIERAWEALTCFKEKVIPWLTELVFSREEESDTEIETLNNNIHATGEQQTNKLISEAELKDKEFETQSALKSAEMEKKANDALSETDTLVQKGTDDAENTINQTNGEISTLSDEIATSNEEAQRNIDNELTDLSDKTVPEMNNKLEGTVGQALDEANSNIEERNQEQQVAIDNEINKLETKYKTTGADIPVSPEIKAQAENPEAKMSTAGLKDGKVSTPESVVTEEKEHNGSTLLYAADKKSGQTTTAAANAAVEKLDGAQKNIAKEDAENANYDMASGKEKTFKVDKTLPAFNFHIINSEKAMVESETAVRSDLKDFFENAMVTDKTLTTLNTTVSDSCRSINKFLESIKTALGNINKESPEEKPTVVSINEANIPSNMALMENK